jgi:hypothetical protein
MSDNFFNNLIRDGYYKSNNNHKEHIINASQKRFETDILLNGKQLFEDKNNLMKSLTDENKILKQKVNIVYEKDSEISELKSIVSKKEMEKDELKLKLAKSEDLEKELVKNKILIDELYKEIDMKNKVIDKLTLDVKDLQNKTMNNDIQNDEEVEHEIKDEVKEVIEDEIKEVVEEELKEVVIDKKIDYKKILKETFRKYLDVSDEKMDIVLEDFDIDEDDISNYGFISYLIKLMKVNKINN